jgi:hypothetical protein
MGKETTNLEEVQEQVHLYRLKTVVELLVQQHVAGEGGLYVVTRAYMRCISCLRGGHRERVETRRRERKKSHDARGNHGMLPAGAVPSPRRSFSISSRPRSIQGQMGMGAKMQKSQVQTTFSEDARNSGATCVYFESTAL